MLSKKLLLFKFSLIILCLSAYANNTSIAPEASSISIDKPLVFAKHQMVVTNNPWASSAADKILEKGGSATDAAIAAGFVLGLTEPQSSGIGGGGYAITYDAQYKKLAAFDGRETAPQSASSDLFLNKNGRPLDFQSAMLSAKSIGVPGEVALFYKMHKDHGKLAWKELLKPAIDLASNGFPMSHRLYDLLSVDQALFANNKPVLDIYFENGKVKKIGTLIKNPDYAKTLKVIAKNPLQIYNGNLAQEIITAINTAANKKLYTKTDFSKYNVIKNKAICSDYRDEYRICSVPPSSSGGITVQELMGIFARNHQGNDPSDINWIYNFLEASKLAYADRNQYIADPEFVLQPINGLLESKYLDARSQIVDQKKPLITPVSAGVPQGIDKKYAPDNSPKPHGTTSISVVDKKGNAVSMTLSIEYQFGSHIFTNGFFLNNQLTDFSFIPQDSNGQLIANRAEPGKRPRSSMSPTIVFDKNNQLKVITGSPGGSPIICYVAKNLIQILDFKKTPKEAVSSGNLCSVNNTPQIESDSSLVSYTKKFMWKTGESLQTLPLTSGVTNIVRTESGWSAAADPRREGMAIGR